MQPVCLSVYALIWLQATDANVSYWFQCVQYLRVNVCAKSVIFDYLYILLSLLAYVSMVGQILYDLYIV